MEFNTTLFGKIDVSDDKILEFPQGILGFEELKRFTLTFDAEKSAPTGLNFMVSLDEPAFMLPVVTAVAVKPDYSPEISAEVEKAIGPLTEENVLVLVTMTIPEDITKMTVNLKAPIIINADTRKGAQIIAENADYEVKYKVYDIFKKKSEEAGE